MKIQRINTQKIIIFTRFVNYNFKDRTFSNRYCRMY